MAERTVDPIIVPFEVTTPAGTLAAAPKFTDIPMNAGRLSNVEIYIPSGHAGQTGIRVELAQQQIMPYSTAPAWVKGNDFRHDFPIDVEVGSGLRVATFNIGIYAHTHYLRFTVWKLVAAPPAARPALRVVGMTG